MQGAPRDLHWILRIPLEPALGEHVRTVGWCERSQKLSDDFLGVSQSVNRSGVDPVHTVVDRVAHGGNRGLVVLRAPRERPTAPARRPRSKPNGSQVQAALAERSLRKCHGLNHIPRFDSPEYALAGEPVKNAGARSITSFRLKAEAASTFRWKCEPRTANPRLRVRFARFWR